MTARVTEIPTNASLRRDHTSRLTLVLAVKFPILRLVNAGGLGAWAALRLLELAGLKPPLEEVGQVTGLAVAATFADDQRRRCRLQLHT